MTAFTELPSQVLVRPLNNTLQWFYLSGQNLYDDVSQLNADKARVEAATNMRCRRDWDYGSSRKILACYSFGTGSNYPYGPYDLTETYVCIDDVLEGAT